MDFKGKVVKQEKTTNKRASPKNSNKIELQYNKEIDTWAVVFGDNICVIHTDMNYLFTHLSKRAKHIPEAVRYDIYSNSWIFYLIEDDILYSDDSDIKNLYSLPLNPNTNTGTAFYEPWTEKKLGRTIKPEYHFHYSNSWSPIVPSNGKIIKGKKV